MTPHTLSRPTRSTLRSAVLAPLAATLVAGLGALLPAQAQTATATRYDFRPVTAEMQAFVTDYALDGASLRVNAHGNVAYRRAFGGYTLDTRVRIASATKWLSALAIARVVEKGQLRWNDTVGQYFPNVEPAKRGITLAQLFSHTSGLPASEGGCLSNPLYTLATCADSILQQPLIGTPGEVFAYGGQSMQVAGRMAELATGKAWDDIFLDEMVRPLGLVATDYATSSTAPGYVRTGNPRIGGGVRSTLEDYGRVLDMVLAEGCLDATLYNTCLPARRFLTRATIAYMAQDRTVGTIRLNEPPTAEGQGYGIGQWIDIADPDVVYSPGAFGFTPWVDRSTKVAGVLLVDDVNTRVAPAINDIRLLVNAVVSAPLSLSAPILPATRAGGGASASAPMPAPASARRDAQRASAGPVGRSAQRER